MCSGTSTRALEGKTSRLRLIFAMPACALSKLPNLLHPKFLGKRFQKLLTVCVLWNSMDLLLTIYTVLAPLLTYTVTLFTTFLQFPHTFPSDTGLL